jgi:hypothetical protein
MGQEFSPLYIIKISSEAQTASCTMDIGALSPGAKQLRRGDDHSSSTSAEVKKM